MFFVDFILEEADDSIILLDNRSQHGNNVSCKSDQYDHQYDDDPHGKPHPFCTKFSFRFNITTWSFTKQLSF